MKINRDNYEAYFLDFAEGKMSPEQEKELHQFLRFNPDLEEELRSFRIHNLTPQSFSYPGKNNLKKEYPAADDSVTGANFDMYCIAYLEKDLTEKQRTVFEVYLAEHPEAEQQFIAYHATFLKKEHIIFPGKERLKHKRSRVFSWKVLVPLAAAAAVAIFIIVSPPVQNLPVEMATVIVPKEKEELVNEAATQKQHVPEPASVNLKVIRNSSSPVPVSNYKKKIQDKVEQKEEKDAATSETVQIASLSFKPVSLMDIPVSNDPLRPEIISPISVNKSSLSFLELARYRFKRASETIEEEDALLWSLASNGLKELNRIRGTETELMAHRNEQEEISGIQFRSRFLNVTAPLNRNED
jgi:hypothetical protein